MMFGMVISVSGKRCLSNKCFGMEEYYEKAVKPNLHAFMGKVFEDMCRYFILKEGTTGGLDCFLTETGGWWGTELLEDSGGRRYRQSCLYTLEELYHGFE